MAYAFLEAGPGYPTGHPVHLLWTLGYLFLALGVEAEDQEEPPFPFLALTLGGLFLMPALLTQEPTPLGVRLLALYGGLVGSLGLLYATFLGWRRTATHTERWTRFLEALARLSPRVTQTLSPEGVLLGALEAAQKLFPEAVGLELRARRGLVGEHTPTPFPFP